jgi:hypothetical protein
MPSLKFMEESTLVRTSLLNIDQLHKWEWYYIFLQYFKYDEILARAWHGVSILVNEINFNYISKKIISRILQEIDLTNRFHKFLIYVYLFHKIDNIWIVVDHDEI